MNMTDVSLVNGKIIYDLRLTEQKGKERYGRNYPFSEGRLTIMENEKGLSRLVSETLFR